jgi:hypothetical protein
MSYAVYSKYKVDKNNVLWVLYRGNSRLVKKPVGAVCGLAY